MKKKSKSCPVCGQRPCVKSSGCVEYKTLGTLNGVPTVIYTYGPSKPKENTK